ncbi:MAG: hypothetical protein LBV26_01680, partial [Bacteroidales bacterium]|nr:hypothetical protein [Bacteroidales bacterium]
AELTDALAVVARENATADAAVYDSFISRLNQRIDLLNTAIARRHGHHGPKTADSDTTPQEQA